MKTQEIFDKVCTHLLTQKKRCTVESDYDACGLVCSYRSEDGTKCAIGALIPDDLYDPLMGGNGVGWILYEYPQFAELLDIRITEGAFAKTEKELRKEKLLKKLQGVHDNIVPPKWLSTLKTVAEEYKLQFNFKGKVNA